MLHAFGASGPGGSTLYASLIMDPGGNLYGTTEFGGSRNGGVVFRLSRGTNGSWNETVLYSFKGGAQDGATPHDSVLLDSGGNLYGTTVSGGGGPCPGGCGVVFQLTPNATGPWTETVLHRFDGTDGATPFSNVILNAAGNILGSTSGGGANGRGTVYKLSPGAAGGWTETVLYSFKGAPDGATPYAGLISDAAGNLYRTTYRGGTTNRGTVYKLSPNGDGTFSETVLHSFRGSTDGEDLFEGLVMDRAGNLYGTAETGGSANCGVVFRLSPSGAGGWAMTILHNFLGLTAQDGANPNALIFDVYGNLYGTTVGGGTYNPGTIFKLSPQPSGEWLETILYNFTGGNDGAYPSAGLIMDGAGRLYGTTLWGGPAGDTTGGVVFGYLP
ncbi:MAG: choice-of-anchor tandem repeat GloVer-containing protein [Bryobacteraceae bacterium]